MNICLLGYGKMGHEIENLGVERGHDFSLIIDIENLKELDSESLKESDVVIDFSTPDSAPENILTCFESGIPVVSGTTGWNDRMEDIVLRCKELNGTFFYASNFSIGVNILFSLNTYLAKIMNRFPDYNVSMKEIHHTQKLDAPSGTAISLANHIIQNHNMIENWSLENDDSSSELHIEAIREGDVTGFHSILYASDIDELVISHNAKSRKGFALGALLAAEYIKDRNGIFDMNDLLNL